MTSSTTGEAFLDDGFLELVKAKATKTDIGVKWLTPESLEKTSLMPEQDDDTISQAHCNVVSRKLAKLKGCLKTAEVEVNKHRQATWNLVGEQLSVKKIEWIGTMKKLCHKRKITEERRSLPHELEQMERHHEEAYQKEAELLDAIVPLDLERKQVKSRFTEPRSKARQQSTQLSPDQ
ncbi:hypothetical protein FPANT_13338 [Fusarium pseudoanthophilum]|uniref:Uncharacterized protein n=1 Tax=Fusarium pseudoanthophilum TaxID=48495 RepID=A0A8H5NQ59_9HYPO|nr:hypothetical protein FPANT_13338 [Fusarium pseudoanthophilum]